MTTVLEWAWVIWFMLVGGGISGYLYGWNLQTIYRDGAAEGRATHRGFRYWWGGINRRLGRFSVLTGLVLLPVLLVLVALFA